MSQSAVKHSERQIDHASDYEADFYSWAMRQAALVREGHFTELDAVNVAEELADLGRSEYKELRSALARVLQHLLKWDWQPEKRSNSWRSSIRVHRVHVQQSLRDNPGLQGKLEEIVPAAYELAVAYAVKDTGMPPSAFPASCPYSFDAIMDRELVD